MNLLGVQVLENSDEDHTAFHNKQIQRRDNRENFKTVEIISVDISALCPRAVFSTIQE